MRKYNLPPFFQYARLLDGTRISDGKLVQLKLIKIGLEEEVEIGNAFSSEPLVSDPRNHCVPILEVLTLEGDPKFSLIIVMPFLRSIHSPKFETVGEAVECLRQIFDVSVLFTKFFIGFLDWIFCSQTILFMHEHNYAHRFVLSQICFFRC
jgi:hypothetical protein